MLNSVISNSLLSQTEYDFLWISLVFFFPDIYYLELGYLEHPAISNCFSLPLAQFNLGYLELYYALKKHWSTGSTVEDVLKAEKHIEVFTVTKAKSD